MCGVLTCVSKYANPRKKRKLCIPILNSIAYEEGPVEFEPPYSSNFYQA